MAEMDNTVAVPEENTGMEQPADDAQAAEISVEELVAQLTDDNSEAETVENEGDDGQPEQEEPQGKQQQETGDKVGRRIAAALRSQRESIFAKELGMSEAEVRELIRAHKAEQMAKDDPEISPKAARRILEAQEMAKAPEPDPRVAELSRQMKEMLERCWTPEEVKALVSDNAVHEDIDNGRTLWQAARAYERRQATAGEAQSKKRAVRTARQSAAGDSPDIDLIKTIPDDKFDAFMDGLRKRAMRGERVRI